MGGCFSAPQDEAGDTAGRANTANELAAEATAEPAFPPVNKDMCLQRSLLGKPLPDDVTEKYDVGRILGAGQFGTTRIATRRSDGKRFAVKSILKSRLVGMEDVANVKQELQIMHHMAGHPNIVQLVEAFEDHLYVHLICELCSGGDLVERIMAKGRYTERDAAGIVRTILKVVAFCHELGVMHRDLKPDNFLLADDGDNAELKVTDFGMSTFVKPGQRLKEVCGTAFYIAPEVLLGDYTEAADVWAVGIITYILLSGRPPFDYARDDDIFRAVVDNGCPDFSSHIWAQITEPAKDCVRQLMTYDYKQRPTARQMLEHEWVREGGVAGDNVIEPEVLHRMRSFAAANRLKQQALLLIAQRLSPDEIRGLKELFSAMDADNSGTISVDELRQGLATRGAALQEDELQRLLALADVDGDGMVDYGEFLAATMHTSKLTHEDNLLMAFRHFDADGDGVITRAELEAALAGGQDGDEGGEGSSGSAFDRAKLQREVAAVLAECDRDQDGTIDYQEFVQMMLGTAHKDDGGDDAAAAGAGPRTRLGGPASCNARRFADMLAAERAASPGGKVT